MQVKLSDYRVNFGYIRDILLANKDKGINRILFTISDVSASTNTPLVVVYYYAKEILGDVPELQRKIEDLIVFYNYSEVKE